MFNRNYARYYDLLNQNKPYKKEIEFVYDWAGKPKWIFDIGCGTANYWKFYPKGTYLLGVEKSPTMISDSRNVICADITKYEHKGRFDCATALFDVMNYIPRHDWWKNIPLDKGGIFIFDIWDARKVIQEGFRETVRVIGDVTRKITPLGYYGKKVDLKIMVTDNGVKCREVHKMYLWTRDDIERFSGNEFEIDKIINTETWQTWYKLIKR